MKTNHTEQTEKSANDMAAWHRKKRIKRMKITIMVIVIILLILPTLFCVFLGFKVERLQNQVEELVSIHKEETAGFTKVADEAGSYAYAAERSTASGQYTPTTQTAGDKEQTAGDKEQTAGDKEQTAGDKEQTAGDKEQTTGDKEQTAGNLGLTSEDMRQASNNSETEEQLLKDMDLYPTPMGEQSIPGIGSEEQLDGEAVSGDAVAPATDETATAIKDPKDKNQETTVMKDSAGESKPTEDEAQTTSTGIYTGKKVYLTFDDGPSLYTDEILDILNEYGVKATFFVIGKNDNESKRLYQRIIDEGHTLGMHSYSHVYKQIYNSTEDFDKDFTKLWKLLYDTTGYMPTIYRFPGGSANKVNKYGMEKFIRYLKDKSIVYYDWNVDNGDATGKEFTKEQLTQNILDGVAVKKRSIVLMHDAQGKRATVDSLPMVLEALNLGKAEVLPLTEDVTPIQQIKAEDVK